MTTIESTARPAVRRRARSRMRAAPLLGMLVLAGAIAGYAWVRTHPAADLASGLITAPAKRGTLVETVTATGSVEAQTGAQVKIGSQITGRIRRLYADVGSHVNAGQLIATLDLPDIQAQLAQAEASLMAARTRAAQQQSGVPLVRSQTSAAIAQAGSDLRSAQARLQSAQAAAKLQGAQAPTDIRRGETGLAAARAALSTARSNLAQAEAGAALQVATAQEQLNQAEASANNAATTLSRQEGLYKQGFVAAADVDTARTQAQVYQSQVKAARQNVDLVKSKVAADTQAARDQVTQAQQNVAAAQASLEAAQAGTYQTAGKQADVRDARAQVARAQENLQLARAGTTQDVLKTQDVLQARQAVSQAQAQVSYYRAQVAKTEIRSPISGTVLQLAAQQGETLAAGLSAPTLIIVADLSRLQVDAYVDETDIGKVRLGQPAEVTVDAFPRRIFRGKVAKVASGSTIQQGVVTYDVTVAIQDPRHQLKPDMSASVTIKTGERPNVLLVPSEAVKTTGARGATVSVLAQRDGRPEIETREVRPGGTDGVNTEIRDGLREGETVVLAGLDQGWGRRGPISPFGPQQGRGGARGGRGRG